MLIRSLAMVMTLMTMTLLGCGGSSTTSTSDPFELQGSWLYLGPWDGEHTLKITDGSMVFTALAGEWSSNWTIQNHDNGVHHFQLVFKSGTGTYSPSGSNFSGTYDLNSGMLAMQLADGLGSYPSVQPTCTENGSTRIRNCGLYMKQ